MSTTPQPGDFAAVSAGGLVGLLISAGEVLDGAGSDAKYQHAFIYTGDGQVVEAAPDGAREVPLRPRALELWSTGLIPLTDAQRTAIVAAARHYVGTPYSFLDYLAITAHHLHLPVPGLQEYVTDTGHMICSQLVDQCYRDAGIQLFPGDWPGYVIPADLGRLLESRKGSS